MLYMSARIKVKSPKSKGINKLELKSNSSTLKPKRNPLFPDINAELYNCQM